MGVQKILGDPAARLAEEALIEGLDIGVVVRLTNGRLLINRIEDVGSLLAIGFQDVGGFFPCKKIGLYERLATAIDAAARAAHDFDESVRRFPSADFI